MQKQKIFQEQQTWNTKEQLNHNLYLLRSTIKKENLNEKSSPTKPKKDIVSSNGSKECEKVLTSSGKLSDSYKKQNYYIKEIPVQMQQSNNTKIKYLYSQPMNRSRSAHEEQKPNNKIKITEVPMNTYYKGSKTIHQVEQKIELIKAPEKCIWLNKQMFKTGACGFYIKSQEFEEHVEKQLEANHKLICKKCNRLVSLKYLILDHKTIFRFLRSQFKHTWECPKQCGYFCVVDMDRSTQKILCPNCTM